MYGYITPTLILIETWTSSTYIYNQHENDRKRLYTQRVMDVEQTFKSSRIRTINRRSRLANTFHVYKVNVGR